RRPRSRRCPLVRGAGSLLLRDFYAMIEAVKRPMKRIAFLGSTGSIGNSTLKICESYPDRFSVVAIAAGKNVDAAFAQCQRWHPKVISLAAEADADALRKKLADAGLKNIEVIHGAAGSVRVATHPDVDFVVSAIVGVAGLDATYEAV